MFPVRLLLTGLSGVQFFMILILLLARMEEGRRVGAEAEFRNQYPHDSYDLSFWLRNFRGSDALLLAAEAMNKKLPTYENPAAMGVFKLLENRGFTPVGLEPQTISEALVAAFGTAQFQRTTW